MLDSTTLNRFQTILANITEVAYRLASAIDRENGIGSIDIADLLFLLQQSVSLMEKVEKETEWKVQSIYPAR